MADEIDAGLALLEKELRDWERNANQLRGTINLIRTKHGLPPLPEGGGGGTGDGGPGSGVITQIQPDTFYGKKLQTAVRMYLEMRKAQGIGPAKPREIYDAVVAGGYQFGATSEEVALVGLRAMLRKRSHVFHKFPNNGTYGMMSWYEHVKAPRPAIPTDNSEPDDGLEIGNEPDDDTDEASVKTSAASSLKKGAVA